MLCVELPFSRLAITALTIHMTTTCDEMYQYHTMTTELCEPVPISAILNMTVLPPDCQPANFSITAHSDARESQPSPPVKSEFMPDTTVRLP